MPCVQSLEDCMAETACPDCHGARLRPEVLAVTVGGRNISEFTAHADHGGTGVSRPAHA